jgi:hypothetical protein
MAFQQAKANFSCVRRAHSQSPPDYQIDEALWAAYRRYDKSAVTEKLLRHYLPGLARIRELNAAGDRGRESVRDEITSTDDLRDSRSGGQKCTQANRTRGKNILRVISKPGKGKHEHASGLKASR